jgi:V-type H+-transporting ATPase subunit H
MSLDPPTYLASLQSNIRQRPIPWDGAVRAGTLTEEQLAKIRAVDKAKKPEQRKQIVEDDLDAYTLLFVGDKSGKSSVLETAAKHPNVIQYILVLLADLLDGVCLFLGSGQPPSPVWPRHHLDLSLLTSSSAT